MAELKAAVTKMQLGTPQNPKKNGVFVRKISKKAGKSAMRPRDECDFPCKNRRNLLFLESVSNPAHGLDGFSFRTDFFAERSNVNIDGSLENQCVFAKSGVDQFRAIESAARLSNQRIQQSELALGQFDRDLSDSDAIPSSIERDTSSGHYVVVLFDPRGSAALKGFDAFEQDSDAEWLGHVIISADGESDQLIRFFGLGGQHDDQSAGGFRFRTQAAADFDPVNDRQHDIEEDDFWQFQLRLSKAISAIVRK
jgi:hypothetical protein